MLVPSVFTGPVDAARNQADRTGTGVEHFQYTPDESRKWREAEAPPPQWPEDGNLLSIPMLLNDNVKVHVDARAVSRGRDGVLRYTLVIDSQAGARNVLYEGIRCETREYKTYAIGTVDRRFRVLKGAAWQYIERIPFNGYRFILYNQFACDTSNSARDPQEFIEALK